MIDLAINHRVQLQKEYQRVILLPDYQYAFCYNYREFEIKIDETTRYREQFVSISNDRINGYLEAMIDHHCNYVKELYIWGAIDRDKKVFSSDLYCFLKSLLNRYNKVVFSCIIGNRIEENYDRICKLLDGRVVGEFEQHVITSDNIKRSLKYYEVMRKEHK
jgi:hypothetical protein